MNKIESSLAPQLDLFFRLDIGEDPKWDGLRTLMQQIAKDPTRAWERQEVAEATGMDEKRVRRMMNRLNVLTNAYAQQLGFSSRLEGMGKNQSIQLSFFEPAKENRQRRLIQAPTGTRFIEITENIRKSVSNLVGIPVIEGVPDNWESLVHNSRVIQRETPDLPYLLDLIDAARKGFAERVELIKARHDIPETNMRIGAGYNLGNNLLRQSLEEGFVCTPVRPNYHAVFFLNADEREKALLLKYSARKELTELDPVKAFSMDAFRWRLREAMRNNQISEKAKKALLQVARNQSKSPITSKDLDLTYNEYYYIVEKTRSRRFELGFYLRKRTDNHLEVVLINREKANADLDRNELIDL